ncbi:hypothetical protein DEI93_16255 (plasmid) [Curtobacterium sp. MCBD17_035]|uniref:alpha/beta hydrolase family protein n=1 Tax=Curtobacterium sp. MCBD17_035 TaxID=2175673 RepID=UPI0011B4B826|nr:hypothetical protein [Curtobacterium sp. MCBD17_035]WIB69179.1 hypothetical protein DEI93_16255 [Curtobacterium sp. MCBD17_035]
MTALITVLAILVVLVCAAAIGVGTVVARRIVLPHPKRRVPVLGAGPDSVTVPAGPATTAPGVHRAYFGNRDARSVLLGPVRAAPSEGTVARPIIGGTAPTSEDSLVWSGYVPDDPAELGPYEEVVYSRRTGRQAWLLPGTATQPANADTWTIHVHGMHSERRAVLRGLSPALEQGMPALVVTYAGDHETPGPNLVTLGQNEWRDVDDAIDYALAHGAHKVILFGWSMGATAALLAATHGTHRAAIAGIVAICPVFDWPAAITAGVRAAHLPAVVAHAGVLILTTPILHQLAGLPRRLRRRDLRPALPPQLPILTVYSRGDEQAPSAVTEALAARHPALELVRFPAVPHGLEVNSDPGLYHLSASQFLRCRA